MTFNFVRYVDEFFEIGFFAFAILLMVGIKVYGKLRGKAKASESA